MAVADEQIFIKHVAASRYRPDQTFRVVSERGANILQALTQRVIRDRDVWPNPCDQLFFVNHAAWIFDEIRE